MKHKFRQRKRKKERERERFVAASKLNFHHEMKKVILSSLSDRFFFHLDKNATQYKSKP